MHILVINSGSSSIKFSMFDAGGGEGATPVCLNEGEVDGIGTGAAGFKFRDAAGNDLRERVGPVRAGSPAEALALVAEAVGGEGMPTVGAVGYRVVHPGPKLEGHVRITDEVMRELEKAAVFAPLHAPAAIEIIYATMAQFPDVAHYACFDTVFHQTMPETATVYAIPDEYRERGVKRYGFHGLSCESIVRQLREARIRLPQRMVIAHLGSGSSVTAVVAGRSVDTTMGLTPTGGVVMGTRPGDLDPGVVLYLLRHMDGEDKVGAVEKLLNRSSGMVALSGLPNDMRAVRAAAAAGDARAKLAVDVFTRNVRKAIGAYCWLMGGLDAIVFSGGIGEHDARSREEILEGLDDLDISVNSAMNTGKGDGVRRISASESKTTVFVVPAKEDVMIAVHVERMAR